MIRDPNELRKFAENYDNTRTANQDVLSILRRYLVPGPGKTGLDIGCGTGNYTIPFEGEFGKVLGIDISDEMLAIARRKSSNVTWICANALNSLLDEASCDAVWLISTLHYFHRERQMLLFKEIYRILKPGGVMVADTEFTEQHASLWVTKFFPSLIGRYKPVVFTTVEYEQRLMEIGFTKVQFDTLTNISEDAGIRLGQHHPERYLNSELRAGIPAFHEMDEGELDLGLKDLERAISNGSISEIIQEYEVRATMPGDVGFIIARR